MALQEEDLNFSGVAKIIRALMNPLASDPGSPANGEIWVNTTEDRLKIRSGGTTYALATTADTGTGVPASTWDANSVVVAITDDTPVAQVLSAGTVVGRRGSGDVTAISYANLKSDLGITSGDISDFDAAVDARTALLVDSAPGTLDTLNELAAALGDDPNFATTMTNSLATKNESYSTNLGDGAATSFVVTHNLGTTDLIPHCKVNATGEKVHVGVVYDTINQVTVSVLTVYATDALRFTLTGV